MKKFFIIFLILFFNLCFAQNLQIDKNRLNEYKIDMNSLLDKILYQKIVFDNETCPEAIEDIYSKSKQSYKILLYSSIILFAKYICANLFA